jgi:hypothetical protein
MTTHLRPLLLALALALALLAGAIPVAAQQNSVELSFTGQPRSYAIKGRPYEVTGYGSARLGMSVDAVRTVIAADYPEAQNTLAEQASPAGGTRALTVLVPKLQPGPGPATITYVFGANSKRLIAINVYWLSSERATPAEHATLTAAAASLASGFVSYQWPPLATARGHVLAPGVLVVFAGRDDAGRGVEIRLDGVPYQLEQRTKASGAAATPTLYIPAPGPAQLRLSLVANVDQPDL